ncbi:MAG TPA: hypothetical protein VJN71_10795 [Nitrososphaerales archaeon]|nr:hypothetical protein [Nitrososphaerales archaeon]
MDALYHYPDNKLVSNSRELYEVKTLTPNIYARDTPIGLLRFTRDPQYLNV